MQQKLEVEFQEQRKSIIEYIAFFSAIITFIISSVQISIQFEIVGALSLIIIMLGTLIVAFGTLRIILKFNKYSVLASIIMSIVGLAFIILGIGVYYYFTKYNVL